MFCRRSLESVPTRVEGLLRIFIVDGARVLVALVLFSKPFRTKAGLATYRGAFDTKPDGLRHPLKSGLRCFYFQEAAQALPLLFGHIRWPTIFVLPLSLMA